jgi:hypothetical protein
VTEALTALGVALVLALAQWIRESADRRRRRAGRKRTRSVDRS